MLFVVTHSKLLLISYNTPSWVKVCSFKFSQTKGSNNLDIPDENNIQHHNIKRQQL